MSRIFCKFCGTEYTTDVAKCPLCGASNVPPVADDFSFLDQEDGVEVTSAPADGAEGKIITPAATPEEPVDHEPRVQPAAMPAYEKKPEPKMANLAEDRKQKNGSAVKIALVLLLVVGLLAAAFFAARATGLFDKTEPESENENEEVQDVPEEPSEIACSGISLDLTEVTLSEIGATQRLTVQLEPEGCTEKVNWISSYPEIAAVDATGLVTAVAEGNVNILVTCGDYAASCMVTVDLTPEEEEEPEPPIDAEQAEEEETEYGEEEQQTEEDAVVGMNYTDITLSNPGEKLQLEVKNLPEGETVEWSCDSDVIVSLDDTGLITATASGTCNVTAKVGEETYTCIVRCNLGTEPGEKITVSLNQTDITMFYEGEQYRLEVGYAEEVPENVSYTWTSSDEDVCTVDDRGTITAVGKGTATVSVDVDGVVLKCTVRVNIEDAEETTAES